MRVDLRSDTVTRPTPGMRRAMAEAEVGDDVYGEDPTALRLEARVAELLGKEAALFVPSGTMANQICVRLHCQAGDEVILEESGHSFAYESGAMGGVSHAQPRPVAGVRGLLSAEAVRRAIRPRADHYPRTRLVILENTSNGGGGTIYSMEQTRAIAGEARSAGLALHLDGARLWNAHLASGVALSELAGPFDTVAACLSKGLGAPVGSMIAGDAVRVREARRLRKMLGGGMRQVGILAAAGLYALEHQLRRLTDDHRRLRALTERIAGLPGLSCEPGAFPTNIAYVQTTAPGGAAELVKRLEAEGVRVNAVGPDAIRMVTHLDIDDAGIEHAARAFAAAAPGS